MRSSPTLVLLGLLAAAATAAAQSLPVHYPGDRVGAPSFAGDVVEIRLAPWAARAAQPLAAGRTEARARLRLGVAGVDAAAASLGGATFEPEFVGETPPPEDDPLDFTAFYLVHLAAGTRLEEALARLRETPGVQSADPIATTSVTSLPNDSLLAFQPWIASATLPRHDIHATEAWDVTRGDSSIVVAIVDTGVLPYHPDLGGSILGLHGNFWINEAEAGGLPGVDDDGNGFVDDVGGWDFVATATTTWASGEDFRDADNDPNDFSGHGTAVSGILAALTDNTIGLAGVAPAIRIMPLRVAWQPDGVGPMSGDVSMAYAAQAIRYATRMGASIINCSFSSIDQNGLGAAVTAATRAGVLVVNASGNNGSPAYLGQRDDVLSVAATDAGDVVWPNSVLGSFVDVCADGVNMVSSAVAWTGQDSIAIRQPTYFGSLNGTSFSSPQAAGVAALIQSQRHAQGRRPLSPQGVILRIRETADDISALNSPSYAGRYGTGRINAYRALTDPPTSTATRALARTVGPPVVLRYNTGLVRVVYATSDRHVVALDGTSGDTVWTAPLPAAAVGRMAAADMGPGLGVRIYVPLATNTVTAMRDDGSPLAGWPVPSLGPLGQPTGGVALGDVDGDGYLDVVCGAADGRVWAWSADGVGFANFPFSLGAAGSSAPALVDVDGQAGDEILVTGSDGIVHAITKDGVEPAGWPFVNTPGTLAPVAARVGSPAAPLSILLASNGSLVALAPNGAPRWSQAISGNVVLEPVVGDLDGDGATEIVLPTTGPNAIQLRDSTGAAITRAGWPLALAAPLSGGPVLGPLRAGARACVGAVNAAGFVAWDDSAHVVPTFPMPGGSGAFPSLGDLHGDGSTIAALGSSISDSTIYALDAGPGTWNAAFASWPTARGNDRRTGYTGTAAPLTIDRIRPGPITDLVASALGTTVARVRWTEPGDDSLVGRAKQVFLYYAAHPFDASTLASANLVGAGQPDSSGRADSLTVPGLDEGQVYWFAVRVLDAAGNASALSNEDTLAMPGLAPATIHDLAVVQVRDSTVKLAWTATGDDGNIGRPVSYTIAASPVAVDSATFDLAPRLVTVLATVDAGGAEMAQLTGLTRGRRWSFAVRATDRAGTRSHVSNVVAAVVPIGGAVSGRVGVALAQRGRPSGRPIVLDWQGASEGIGRAQEIRVYDLGGRLVRREAVGGEPGGTWNWDGRDGASRLLPAGLYFARLQSGGFHAETRVVLVP